MGSSSGQRQGNLFGGVVSPVVEREISVPDPIGESLKTAVARIDPDSTSPKQALELIYQLCKIVKPAV